MGREQQAAGAALERDIDAFHARLYDDWYIQRNHPKDRRSKGPPDYMAVYEGRAFLFDAKASGGERWSLHLLKPHQATALERFTRAGATAGLYLRLANHTPMVGYPIGRLDLWVSWPTISERWRRWYVTGVSDYLTRLDGEPIFGGDWTAPARGLGLPPGQPMFPERGGPSDPVADLFTPLRGVR